MSEIFKGQGGSVEIGGEKIPIVSWSATTGPSASSKVMAVDLSDEASFTVWMCGRIGCTHATHEGAMFHWLMMQPDS